MKNSATRPLIVAYDHTVLIAALREQISSRGVFIPQVPPINPDTPYSDLLAIAKAGRLTDGGLLVVANFSEEALEFALDAINKHIPGSATEKITQGFRQFVEDELDHCLRRDVPRTLASSHHNRVGELRENLVLKIRPVFLIATASAARDLHFIRDVRVIEASYWREQAINMTPASAS